ncbi:hypothetical protein MB27_39415 [Actinoplanes utahensis]|uniref:Uncharacterized protein n=1 Tax=Actinoplanes utahensis TaxID=1869 RepID=A0A0A6UDZ3_ACTUT|nr:hypothetical protein MB27_39415 [Actinoplanes utahensis]
MVIVGLPFAVVTGWALGAPAVRPAAFGGDGTLHGADRIGSAPRKTSPPRDSPAGYTARPPRSTAVPPRATVPAAVPSTVVTTVTTVTIVQSVPVPPASTTDPPLLTLPPVPTPTQVAPSGPAETPPVPTATTTSVTPSFSAGDNP